MKNTNKKFRDVARELGSRGGKQSVKSRFAGKTKAEISEMMRKVRMTDKMADAFVKNLNDNVR